MHIYSHNNLVREIAAHEGFNTFNTIFSAVASSKSAELITNDVDTRLVSSDSKHSISIPIDPAMLGMFEFKSVDLLLAFDEPPVTKVMGYLYAEGIIDAPDEYLKDTIILNSYEELCALLDRQVEYHKEFAAFATSGQAVTIAITTENPKELCDTLNRYIDFEYIRNSK